ncbi:hypothetical protein [Actinotalea subterranea]|uniref:hypothetical protein n=1 Tax=Actinotalea subterranea TaxID=2607497 RepID=UPI0011EBC8D3|nr:hypothetical protein [Actinotalea subterranea]
MTGAAPERDAQWVAYVLGAHRTGTVTALAQVFSARGVNFDSLSTSDIDGKTGLVVITFRATERRRRLLARTLERLAAVRDVRVVAADDPVVRAVVVVSHQVGAASHAADDAGVPGPADQVPGRPLVVEGTLRDVERVAQDARRRGASSVTTLVLPPAP